MPGNGLAWQPLKVNMAEYKAGCLTSGFIREF